MAAMDTFSKTNVLLGWGIPAPADLRLIFCTMRCGVSVSDRVKMMKGRVKHGITQCIWTVQQQQDSDGFSG